MDTKQLGNTGLRTSPIVIGGNVFGWTLNESESFDVLDSVFEAGFHTIDTSNSYSHWADGNDGGESETIIGKWMKKRGNRDDITIITKVGSAMGGEHTNLSEEYILKAADESLQRLQVEQIDLYLTHWDDERTPVEETLGAYQKLIEAGKVRYIGASNLSPERLTESLEVSEKQNLPRYEVFQPEYNLYDRQGYEQGVASICNEQDLGVITYYSLASGFLTGKYRSEDDLDKSVRGSSTKKYLNERGNRILAALDQIAEKKNISPASVSLAWLINNPNVTAPIASATKPHHIKAFTKATQISLDPDDMQVLNEASGYS